MAKSIIQKDDNDWKSCFICGLPNSDLHHIFGKCNRRHSDDDGLVVYLCRHHHTSVHRRKDLMQDMHELGQTAYEKEHSREEFMSRYGKNYL